MVQFSFMGAIDHLSIDSVCCTWRKGLRRLCDNPYRTHCNILPLLCNELPLYDEISKRIQPTLLIRISLVTAHWLSVLFTVHRGIYIERMRSSVGTKCFDLL
jgi:hypothetical protein